MLKPLTVWRKPSNDMTITVMRKDNGKWLAFGKINSKDEAKILVDDLPMAEMERWLSVNGYESYSRSGGTQVVTTYPGDNGQTEVEYPQ